MAQAVWRVWAGADVRAAVVGEFWGGGGREGEFGGGGGGAVGVVPAALARRHPAGCCRVAPRGPAAAATAARTLVRVDCIGVRQTPQRRWPRLDEARRWVGPPCAPVPSVAALVSWRTGDGGDPLRGGARPFTATSGPWAEPRRTRRRRPWRGKERRHADGRTPRRLRASASSLRTGARWGHGRGRRRRRRPTAASVACVATLERSTAAAAVCAPAACARRGPGSPARHGRPGGGGGVPPPSTAL